MAIYCKCSNCSTYFKFYDEEQKPICPVCGSKEVEVGDYEPNNVINYLSSSNIEELEKAKMKTINIDFLAKDDTIFHLLLAYIYDEIKNTGNNSERQKNIVKITELHQMDATLRHVRFGGYDYRDGLENLVGLSNTIHIYETFKDFINERFPEYKKIRIIGNSDNGYWINDLEKYQLNL